jgi:HAD superfamily hydrolase (TIGR01490 family)
MAVAFFDVDHTLIRGSSAFYCAEVFRKEGLFGKGIMLGVAWSHLLHKLGLLNYEAAYAKAVVPFAGLSLERLEVLSQQCFDERVRPAIFTEALARLREHHEAGERVVLLSASSVYLLERFREVAPIDEVIAFKQRATDGKLIADYDRPICYGPNKLVLAERYLAPLGIPVSDCAFYSDSSSDLPMLEAVGRPYAVNPDWSLRRRAQAAGWPILRFKGCIGG